MCCVIVYSDQLLVGSLYTFISYQDTDPPESVFKVELKYFVVARFSVSVLILNVVKSIYFFK